LSKGGSSFSNSSSTSSSSSSSSSNNLSERKSKRQDRMRTRGMREKRTATMLFRWPYPPQRSRVEITDLDLERVNEDFLNDSLIDFFLRKIQDEKGSETKATLENAFYLFNTFFYTRYRQGWENFRKSDYQGQQLTQKTQRTKAAYDGVRRWWKGVDLFSKDFLVVPINLDLHWSLMIICHPGKFKTFLDYELDFALKEQTQAKQKKEQKKEQKKGKDGKDVHVDVVDDMDYKNNFPEYKENDPYFCVLHLDSLRLHNSTKVGNSLVEILYHAWVDTHAVARNMEASEVRRLVSMEHAYQMDSTNHTRFQRTKKMKVPEQDNSTDCGVFTCNYVQQFATEIKKLKQKKEPTIVTKAMFDSRHWEWLNNDWFKEFNDISGVSIGKTMRNQLHYDVEQCQKGYQIALKEAEKQIQQGNDKDDENKKEKKEEKKESAPISSVAFSSSSSSSSSSSPSTETRTQELQYLRSENSNLRSENQELRSLLSVPVINVDDPTQGDEEMIPSRVVMREAKKRKRETWETTATSSHEHIIQQEQKKTKVKVERMNDILDDSMKATKKAEEALEEQLKCIICWDEERKRSIFVLPCRHFDMCKLCAPSVANCPTCRAVITHRHEVYLS